ncbi:MAG: hypothetical protein L0Z70_00875 [Chloroflexi bacterium]|nr:hypothetical protein [Chloroflexota bacterium]
MSQGFLLILTFLIGAATGFAIGVLVGQRAGKETAREPASLPEVVQEPPAPAEPADRRKEAEQPAAPLRIEPALGERPSQLQLNRPSLNPVDVFARALQGDSRAPASPPKSIALQVDEILQENLKGTPLEEKAIRLMELPGRGMVVMVGLDSYDGVDAVPDEEVRKAIRAAAAEWELRAGE